MGPIVSGGITCILVGNTTSTKLRICCPFLRLSGGDITLQCTRCKSWSLEFLGIFEKDYNQDNIGYAVPKVDGYLVVKRC